MNKNLKKIWIIGIGILLIVLAVVGISLGKKINSRKEKNTEVSHVEDAAEATKENVEEVEDALQVSMNVLNLPYLSADQHTLYYLKESEYGVYSTPVEKSGIICADLYDYDKDGSDEILTIVMLGSDVDNFEQEFVMYMLETGDSGQWKKTASEVLYSEDGDYNVGGYLYSIICPGRMEFFVKDAGDHVYIYAEGTGISQYFADGISWALGRFEYQDQEFRTVGEPVGMAGSDDVSWACFNMDVNYEYEQEYIREFVGKVRALDIDPEKLGWEYPITNGDDTLRSLVRIIKGNDFTHDKVYEWQRSSTQEPLGNIMVIIRDFCNLESEEITEETSDVNYTVTIETYPQNDDITYPQFGPSSPSVDAWNTYFLEFAAKRQQEENDMILEGVEQADRVLNSEVVYQEGNVVSISFFDYVYAGGAHGSYVTTGKTIDLSSQHEYTLAELLNTDEVTAVWMVNQAFNQLIYDNPDQFFTDVYSELNITDYQDYIGYYKTPEGIKIHGALYWLAPFAYGEPVITLQPVK